MDTNRFALLIGAWAIAATAASANDEGSQMTVDPVHKEQITSFASNVTPASSKSQIVPRIHIDLPRDLRVRVQAGFAIAVEKVQDIPECRALFEELGADALETLRTGHFSQVNSIWKERTMCSGVVAFTNVGIPLTYLCRRFARLSDQQAAIYIIHEALHHAGLTEQPRDRDAMTSCAINRMVVVACHF